MLRRSALGAGVLATGSLAPTISGVGQAPAHAQVCSTGPPLVEAICRSVPTMCSETVTLELTPVLRAINSPDFVNQAEREAIEAFISSQTLTQTVEVTVVWPAVCPGDAFVPSGAVSMTGFDVCSLHNQLRQALPDNFGGSTFSSPPRLVLGGTDDRVGLSLIRSSESTSDDPLQPCASSLVSQSDLVASLRILEVPPVPAPILDPDTCQFQCPPAPADEEIRVQGGDPRFDEPRTISAAVGGTLSFEFVRPASVIDPDVPFGAPTQQVTFGFGFGTLFMYPDCLPEMNVEIVCT